MKREKVLALIKFLVPILFEVKFEGGENVPKEGGFILTTNHMSRFDTPLLSLTPGRVDVIALVADKYKKDLFFSWLVNNTGCIWLDRDKADFAAMRTAIEYIRKGGALGIAPEGTRSTVGQLIEGKPGTLLLAERARVPVVPVGIAGTEDVMRKLRRLQKAHITVRYGPAYTIPAIERTDRESWMKHWTDEMMCRIAALLPEKYHGFYAGHPRLRELLS
jgi:1-acyl-sn-glycerol-3-phosphate acyltransferase